MHISTKTRARRAQEIAAKHYEEGNQSKNLKAVWRRYIEPQMGICYASFLAYLNASIGGSDG